MFVLLVFVLMTFYILNVNFYHRQGHLNFNEKKRTTSKNIVEPVQLLALWPWFLILDKNAVVIPRYEATANLRIPLCKQRIPF